MDDYTASAARTFPAVTGWSNVSAFIQTFKELSEAEETRFAQLYEESRGRLIPLSDPLDVVFSLHRQLAPSREEVYSDWLQWVLQNLDDPSLIGHVLGASGWERLSNSKNRIEINREECVEHGHRNQTGRLDLIIRVGNNQLAVIEVKTRPYNRLGLEKHQGYRRSVNSPDTDLILLSVNPPDSDPGNFRFLSWANVCVALRRIAPTLLRPERVVGTALILAFVGAVEQNLLRFGSPGRSSSLIGKVPRMVDHLTKTLQTEELFGKS